MKLLKKVFCMIETINNIPVLIMMMFLTMKWQRNKPYLVLSYDWFILIGNELMNFDDLLAKEVNNLKYIFRKDK